MPSYLSLIKYLKTDGESRTCPICSKQFIFISDDINAVYKCISCGYARQKISLIEGQHRYDHPVTILTAKKIKSWYEMQQSVEEKLYNLLLNYDWPVDQAARDVIRDLNLDKDRAEHFLIRVRSVQGMD